jgi:hypothetical protein
LAKVSIIAGRGYYRGMTERQRQLAFLRFMEIEAELEALADGRVVDGDPATVEGELLEEQEEIEFVLGEDFLERRSDE